jgi:hypothetical protein
MSTVRKLQAVPSLVVPRGPEPPAPRAQVMESGEYPATRQQPLRRRSIDNLAAVRVPASPKIEAPRETNDIYSLDDPENEVTAKLELDRQSPVSGPGGTGHRVATRLVDADDFDEVPESMLELQMGGMQIREEAWPKSKPGQAKPMPKVGPRAVSHDHLRAIPPPAFSQMPTSQSTAVVTQDTRTVFAAFAGFGDPPRSLFEAPGYAFRVLVRRRVLVRELEHARKHRRADVALYEQALKSADHSAIRRGYAVVVGLFVLVFAAAFAASSFLNDAPPLP